MSLQPLSITNILCPTDFSDGADAALTRAATIARWFQARVTLLHVLPYGVPGSSRAAAGDHAAHGEHAGTAHEAEVDAAMARIASSHLALGTRVDMRVTVGQPWREIAAMAETIQADLVVMGTHGREGWDRLVMGSTTEKLARRLKCPVLVVGPSALVKPGLLFRNVLCPLDLTHESRQTIDLAFAMAEENLAEVTLLHVLDGTRRDLEAERPLIPSRSTFEKGAVEAATGDLRALVERSWTFCRTKLTVTSGTPWRKIISTAAGIGADLIVMGAHGDAGHEPLLLGSTADQVMRHAPCPVLLAKPFGYRSPHGPAAKIHRDEAPSAV